MRIPSLLILVLTAATWQACDKNGDASSVYEGCCGQPPLYATFGNARLYAANIFTPNFDGINDLFYIQGDSLARIIQLVITDPSGEIAFSASDFPANDPAYAWDGTVRDTVREGLYTIALSAEALDGTTQLLSGFVCNYPCGQTSGPGNFPLIECGFPAQWYCWEWEHGCENLEDPACCP